MKKEKANSQQKNKQITLKESILTSILGNPRLRAKLALELDVDTSAIIRYAKKEGKKGCAPLTEKRALIIISEQLGISENKLFNKK